jgi:lipoprotein-anchoring transpeptidase ErfK/SrfK
VRADFRRLIAGQLPRVSRAGLAHARAGVSAIRRFCAGHVWQTAAGGLALAIVCAGAVVAAAVSGSGTPPGRTAGPGRPANVAQRIVLPVPVTAAELAKLPSATTYGTTPAAPPDPSPFAVTSGLVVRPLMTVVLYAGPGKPPVAVLPATQLGGPTWVPVVQTSPGWDRVLLPSKPNGATGWIYTGSAGRSQVDTADSAYLVRISVGARKLSLYDAGQQLGTWTVAVGAPGTPTPTGRTFVLALLAPAHPTYSPLILPLGFHSNTLDTYGGGPGTVGLHGWPDVSVFGQAISHGCVRVPADALTALSRVPLGSLVVITQ